MSTYDDSSLFLYPSGYKASVLFAQKPMDANGQLAFTRSNDTATRVASNGLIEKVRTNLVLQSNSFDTTWTNVSTTETGGQAGYDGTNNAWLLQNTALAGRIQQGTFASGLYTMSVYAKAGNVNWVQLYADDTASANDPVCYFDLQNGVVGSSSFVIDKKIESVGNGWYRCSFSFSIANTFNYLIFPASADNVRASSGGNILIQAAQLETGDIATAYIATTTAAVSVGPVANIPRLDYLNSSCARLLLEPQTTALNQFSESFDNAFWIKNDVTISANTTDTLDPAGYYGADKVVETATPARHRVAAGSTTISAANHTASVFMKKGTARYGFVTFSGAAVSTIVVDLENGTITSTSTSGTIVAQKVEDYGSGWYRISVTALGTATTTTYTLQFGSAGSATPSYTSNIPSFTGSTSNYLYAWGANLTATSYLQSYIPTLAASVTRGADACYKENIAGTLPTAYPLTLFGEFEITQASEGQALTFSNAAASNEYFSIDYSSGFYRALSRPSNVISLVTSTVAATLGFHKICGVFTSTTIKLFVDGALVASGANAQAFNASINDIFVGQLRSVTDTGNRNSVKQAIVFKSELSDADCIALTA